MLDPTAHDKHQRHHVGLVFHVGVCPSPRIANKSLFHGGAVVVWPPFLLVVLGSLHVPLLDVLPLALHTVLAHARLHARGITYATVDGVPDLV